MLDCFNKLADSAPTFPATPLAPPPAPVETNLREAGWVAFGVEFGKRIACQLDPQHDVEFRFELERVFYEKIKYQN